MTRITIQLPDDPVREAEGAGLLAPERLEEMIRAELRRHHLRELRRLSDEPIATELPRMTMDEIQAEVNAVRQARRARAARS